MLMAQIIGVLSLYHCAKYYLPNVKMRNGGGGV